MMTKSVQEGVQEGVKPTKMHVGKTWRCVSPADELELAGQAFSTACAPGQYVFALHWVHEPPATP